VSASASDYCYRAIGGREGCRNLSEVFYGYVAQDPILKPIFPASLRCAIDAFTLYLAQALGGPCEYSQSRWWLSLREAHLRFRIGENERKAWLTNMQRALRAISIDPSAGAALLAFFEESSKRLLNHPTSPDASEHFGGRTSRRRFDQELQRCSKTERLLEEMVAALRKSDPARAIELAASPDAETYFRRNPADLAALLALMISTGHVDYVRHRVAEDSGLIHQQYTYGRTLLHDAAVSGDTVLTGWLLERGANPNGECGRPPLYCVANESSAPTGAVIVYLLVKAGADPNAREGVKQCSALHMAARRGNAPVARALLESGADIEARDSAGDSPLRRAVNCSKLEVVALLLKHGADADSKGSKGLTPRQAARTERMKQLFRS